MVEVVTRENLADYDAFVLRHPLGSFLQSSLWARQKPDWHWRALIRRNQWGRITGTLAVLCRRVPWLGCSMVYGCRGPVCDPDDRETLDELLTALKKLARQERAYLVRLDPMMPEGGPTDRFAERGFKVRRRRRSYQPAQPRRAWMLALGSVPDRIPDTFTPEHRQRVQMAVRRGVTVRRGGRELAAAFTELMQAAGLREGRVVRPEAYFTGLMENFGSRAAIYLADYEGRTVAGALVIAYGGKATCVFEAWDGDVTLPAPYLLRTVILEQSAAAGCRAAFFPGTYRRRESPEYEFAAGFGGQLVRYAGELDLVVRPLTNLLADAAGALAARFRRWLYFIRVR